MSQERRVRDAADYRAPLPVDHQHRHSQPTSAAKAMSSTIKVSSGYGRDRRQSVRFGHCVAISHLVDANSKYEPRES
jgi:hypothetical protein